MPKDAPQNPVTPTKEPVVRCFTCAQKKWRTPQGLWNDLKQWFCSIDCLKTWRSKDVGHMADRHHNSNLYFL